MHIFHRIIALYAKLKPNPVWLFPVQLESIHICEECTISKAKKRNEGWDHIRCSLKYIIKTKHLVLVLIFVFQIQMCFVKNRLVFSNV